jgi:hypothetical protein
MQNARARTQGKKELWEAKRRSEKIKARASAISMEK